jgi:site-specific DNA recombinase
MEAIALVRVSTSHQATEGTSISAQKRKIEAYCEANGLTLVRIFEEAGISGTKGLDQRDILSECLDEVCRRKATLIIYSLSRLSRSMRTSLAILDRLQKHGCGIVSMSEKIDSTGASGALVTNLLILLQEFEVQQLRERVTYCMSHLRKSNKRISRFAPYGYDLAANAEDLVENPTERAVIEQMKALRASGGSLRQIASALSDIPTKTGTQWSATVIRGILNRESKLSLAA